MTFRVVLEFDPDTDSYSAVCPELTADQVVRVLKKHGFAMAGQSGSHQKWRNSSAGKR